MTETVDVTTRSARTAMEIAAPVEAVWRALTEAPEIVRWFALDAEVEPGPGGAVTWRWADAYRWSTRIEIWEPLRRLTLAYEQTKVDDHRELGAAGSRSLGGYDLVVDFQIEAVSGGTCLRCVHSGFGRDAEWDNELEGVRKGWLAELESLRHYLERHRGEDRRAWWAFFQPGESMVDAWLSLVPGTGSMSGMIRTGEDGGVRLNVPGHETALVPVRLDPPGDLVARVPAWNDAMLRIWCDPHGSDGSIVSLFLSFYGRTVDAERAEAKAALLAWMRQTLGAHDATVTVLET